MAGRFRAAQRRNGRALAAVLASLLAAATLPAFGGCATRVSNASNASTASNASAASAASAASTASAASATTEAPGIDAPLAAAGDPARGRAIAFERESACVLCHQLPAATPDAPLPAGGDLGPPLAGTGARWTAAQLRLRLVDPARVNPQTIMPAYLRRDGLVSVAANYRGRTILNEQQIEDLVAWLSTLK